jgi:Protein of unknown function (DUF3800)
MGSVLRFPLLGAWEGLSGTPLNGNNVTRFIYIDEAGISNLRQEPWLVVVGVIVDADRQLVHLERRIASIIDRHIPEHQRDGFVFHAMHLFNGGGPVFKRDLWPLSKRLEIADELAGLPKKVGLSIAVGAIDRSEFGSDFSPADWDGGDATSWAHATAFTVCSAHVDLWMRRRASNEVCMMIVEDNPQMRTLLTDLQRAHQNPKLANLLAGEATKILPFRKTKASPLFEQKNQSVSLQLADFCAYVMKKAHMRDDRYAKLFKMIRPYLIHEINPDADSSSLAGSPLLRQR